MFKRLHEQRGLTIIETTVILSVMFILAGAMSPIVAESVGTARAIKAQNDASMIAMGLLNLQKDMGAGALAASAAQALGLPDVLASEGSAPSTDEANIEQEPDVTVPLLRQPGQGRSADAARASTRAQRRRWSEVNEGALDDHLLTNRRGYRFRAPGQNDGWTGPYLSRDIKGDPWGNQYLINSHWLDGGTTPVDARGRQRRAVFVVSAGSNGTIETPYEQPLTDAQAYGDDIVIRLQ